jgi:hypothetical protein
MSRLMFFWPSLGLKATALVGFGLKATKPRPVTHPTFEVPPTYLRLSLVFGFLLVSLNRV